MDNLVDENYDLQKQVGVPRSPRAHPAPATPSRLLSLAALVALCAQVVDYDALVDENYDLQAEISRLRERLERAERSSSTAGDVGARADAQDGRAGA